jgi:hypothetical protein
MNKSILALATTVLLMLTAHTGIAAEPIHVFAPPEAAASANLIARADRALREYVAACSTSDHEAFARIVASDAMVEYALGKPGTYLTVEAAALCVNHSDNAGQTRSAAQISNLRIYSTPDSNTVFANYTIDSDVRSPAEPPDSEHLALLEMRGERIFKIRHFGTLSTIEASLLARAIGLPPGSTRTTRRPCRQGSLADSARRRRI